MAFARRGTEDVISRWDNFLTPQTTQSLSNPSEKIDGHRVVFRNTFVSGADEIIDYVSKAYYKTWLTTKMCMRIDERKDVRPGVSAMR